MSNDNANRNKGIFYDTLFVGPTRPTTYWGVPWQAFIINVIVTMEAFVFTRNLTWLLLFIPVHMICYLICLRDIRTFELIFLWGKDKGIAYLGNFRYWQSASYSPLKMNSVKNKKRHKRRKMES